MNAKASAQYYVKLEYHVQRNNLKVTLSITEV